MYVNLNLNEIGAKLHFSSNFFVKKSQDSICFRACLEGALGLPLGGGLPLNETKMDPSFFGNEDFNFTFDLK